MRSLVLEATGSNPRVVLVDRPVPQPAEGEIQVRIEAAALNLLDAKIAAGEMQDWFPVQLPYLPGTDFAGTVEAVGSSITEFAIGDVVFGRSDPARGGALADYILVAAALATHRPSNITACEAACLPTPAGIAWQVLTPMLAGDDPTPILVLGEGQVVQAAAAIGGADVRLLSDPARLDDLDGPRRLFDAAGGDAQRSAVTRLPRGSHVVSIVSPVAQAVAADSGLSAEFAVLDTSRGQLDALAPLTADGLLRPHADHLATLDQAAGLFARYVAREVAGKIVIQGARS